MQLLRLSGRKVCERVKTKGFLWKGKHLQARYLSGAPRHLKAPPSDALFVGLLTSTKLHKSAVKRNRMRRRCREALRITLREKSKPREAAGLAGPAAARPDEVRSDGESHQMRKGGSAGGTPGVALPRMYQLILLPRSSSPSAPFGELLLDAERLIHHLSGVRH